MADYLSSASLQLDLVPSDQIMAMSADQYQKFMDEPEVITGAKDARMDRRVGERISTEVSGWPHRARADRLPNS